MLREPAETLPLALLSYPAQLPAVLQGKTVVVGREGNTVDLPCKSSQEKSMFFIWKLSDQTRILGNQNNFVTRGRIPCPPTQGGKQLSELAGGNLCLGSPMSWAGQG